MTNNSTYTRHLPPVLWREAEDPTRLLGRSLRIFERILSGVHIRAPVVRASAPMANAAATTIQLASADHARAFRVGDVVTIEGTAEREEIQSIAGAALNLVNPLVGGHGPGVVRVANLLVGQQRFRLENTNLLSPGSVVTIVQGPNREDATIQAVDIDFVTLQFGLSREYPLADSHMPVVLLDGVPLTYNGNPQIDLRTTIAARANLFSPYRTKTDYLPYLASWLAFEPRDHWTEYQTRNLISVMGEIYKERGLKRGLHTYLDIYADVGASRPRIALDDGEAVIRVDLSPEGAALHEIAHAETLQLNAFFSSPLLHPTGFAADNSNTYFVTDAGDMTLGDPRPPAVWMLSSTGEIPYTSVGGVPRPDPIHSGPPLEQPVAAVVDGANAVVVLDAGTAGGNPTKQDSGLFRFTPPGYPISTIADQTTVPKLSAIHPVDMVQDGAGDFVILDRGLHPLGDPPAGPTDPKIVVVSEGVLSVTDHALPALEEPRAILLEPGGTFLAADARTQTTTAPGDIFRIDPGAGFSQTSLLNDPMNPVPNNPLIHPVGLTWQAPDIVLVLDLRVRWGSVVTADNRVMAEEACLFSVDLTSAPPVITQIGVGRRLVQPTSLGADAENRLIVTERGETARSGVGRNWRSNTNEFGVQVLYSNQRFTPIAERHAILRGILALVDEHKVGHTQWWIDF